MSESAYEGYRNEVACVVCSSSVAVRHHLCPSCSGEQRPSRPRWAVYTRRHGQQLTPVPIRFASEQLARRYVKRFGGTLVPPAEEART